jgi:RimJ/RimL family protein N-acetyltransferase
MPVLSTTFGCLRPWESGDAPALANYGNNRKIWLNLRDGFPHPYTLENARSFLEHMAHQDPITFYAIATPQEAIGGIGISLNQDVHRLTAELGYWLAEPFWGRGIVSEAVTRFSRFSLDEFGLIRLYAEPYASNPASARVLEKAGYTLEGRMRASVFKDGRILDQMLYSLVRLPTQTDP